MRGTPALFFKSLNQHFNILGVEKDLFFLNIGLCVPIAMSARFSLLMDIIAVAALIVGHISGILITRTDPLMKKIYLRHIAFRKYYPPISGIHAKPKTTKISVPVYQGKGGLV